MSLRKRPLTSSYGALSEHGPWVRCGQSFTFFRHRKTHIFSDVPAAFHWLLMLRTKLLDQRFTQIVTACNSKRRNKTGKSFSKLKEFGRWLACFISGATHHVTICEKAALICVRQVHAWAGKAAIGTLENGIFRSRTQKCKWHEPALPHGASVSFSAVEVKGMQPNAMNFSERTTSIYVFILR